MMVWVRVPDDLPERPEALAVSPTALALHVAALCYSNRNLTDGAVPAPKALTLTTAGDVAVVVDELVSAGWWERTASGFQLVYLLDLQPTAEQVRATRGGWAKRSAAYRGRRSERARHAVTEQRVTPVLTPVLTPVQPPHTPPAPLKGADPDPDPDPVHGFDVQDHGQVSGGDSRARAPHDASSMTAPPGDPQPLVSLRLASIVERVRAHGCAIFPTDRDRERLLSCAAPAELIAEAYVAAAQGTWTDGDNWLRTNLSLHAVIDRLAGYVVTLDASDLPAVDYRASRRGRLPDRLDVERADGERYAF